VVIGEVDDGPVRKDSPQTRLENFPIPLAEETVAEHEAAVQQVRPQRGCLAIGEFPCPRQTNEEKGIEFRVTLVEIHGLLDSTSADAAQASNDLDHRPIATGVVVGPAGAALSPVPSTEEAEPAAGIHQAAEHELAGNLPIRR